MRRTWGRWTCVAIGLSASGGGAQARESAFEATIVPARTPTAPGAGLIPSVPGQAPSNISGHIASKASSPRRSAFSIVAMPPKLRSAALQTDPGSRTPRPVYDLRIADAYRANRLAPLKASVQVRSTGMKDAYFHGRGGLRVSVGSSYHMKYRAANTGPGAPAGSAALMRLPAGAVNLRDGYESYAPVAMVGYDALIGDRMKIGVEGGMMVGRSTAMYADETVPDTHDMSHGTHNPVADLVMSYAF